LTAQETFAQLSKSERVFMEYFESKEIRGSKEVWKYENEAG